MPLHDEEIFTKTSTETIQDHDDFERKSNNVLRITSMACYFLRMPFQRKLTFMTELSRRIRSLGTIALLINTLYSTTGKIKSYCLVSTNSIIFDKAPYDHYRMVDPVILNEFIAADLRWYETLDDREQVAYLIILYRHCGGALCRLFYERLQKIYACRLRKVSGSQKSTTKTDEEKIEIDYTDSKQEKVTKLTAAWNDTIAAMRKTLSPPKKPKKTKKKAKGKEQSIDWIQLMPIQIVKKIFNYLDKHTLKKASKVNAYWKWAIKELLKDRKTSKKLKLFSGTLPVDTTVKPKLSNKQRRVKKLERRGAILDRLRLADMEANFSSAVILEAMKKDEMWCADRLTIFPRVVRGKPLMEKKPRYVVKDVNLIYETQEDSEEEEGSIWLSFSSNT